MRRKVRLARAWAAIVVMALAVAGCAGGAADDDESPGRGGTPKRGGTLTVADTNEVTSLDPTSTTTAAGAGGLPFYALYDALFTLDAETGEVSPKIGLSLTPDATQKVWTLKLRPNVKFSDGTPYDAAAVAFSWKRAKGSKSALAGAASGIASTKVIEPTTLEVTLTEPDSGFDRLVAQQLLFIASPAAVKSAGAKFGTKPVGAGPFTLTSWTRDSEKRFERNAAYYDAPKPHLDKLVIKIIPDATQSATALKTGQANLLYTQDLSVIEQLKAAGMRATTVTTPGSPNLAFNLKKPPFDDPNIRKAVVQAVDTAQMAKVIGNSVPTAAPFPTESPYNYGLSWPSYSKENAQRLFDEYAAAHGGPVTFTIESFQGTGNVKEGEFFQTALNQYRNVKVKLTVASGATAIGNVFSGNFQAHTWGAPWYGPHALNNFLHSGQQLNVYGYNNPAVDKALDAARATGDQAQQDAHYRTVVEHMVNDLPFFNYGVRHAANVYSSEVQNVKLFYDAYPFLESIWLG